MRIRPVLALAAVLAAVASQSHSAVKSRVVDYTAPDGTQLQGYVAWDDAAKAKRPGVLVVHEWWGHNAHARRAADRLARAGYVGFALDMFGKGKLAFKVEPWAHVYLLGKRVGTTPMKPLELYEGDYKVRLWNDETGKEREKIVRVKPNATEVVKESLE